MPWKPHLYADIPAPVGAEYVTISPEQYDRRAGLAVIVAVGEVTIVRFFGADEAVHPFLV
jgi:hypothetical protein